MNFHGGQTFFGQKMHGVVILNVNGRTIDQLIIMARYKRSFMKGLI